ncbi:MAG TPA: hypothetical protein VG797_02815 [Phycisphaerales bacterium]|nr:hypothetical protein [Phycisphaerales bacterium]
MGYSNRKQRTAWEDRFKTPTFEDLRSHYNKQLSSLIEMTRERLMSFPGVTEEVSWEGLPWRWTLTYRCPDDPTRAWAYLVPDPVAPKVSMPLTADMIGAFPMHRMKKHIRDGVTGARVVGPIHWATFAVSSKAVLDDVLDLAKRKHQFVMAQN